MEFSTEVKPDVITTSKVITTPRAVTTPDIHSDVVIHAANARPAEPPVGMIYFDATTGYREQWDGREWIPQKKESWRR